MEQVDEWQQQWSSLAKKFARVTDRLGMPIDEPIMETVIALNALGITTSMSCGGHIEEGKRFAVPWVTFAEKNMEHDDLIRRSEEKQDDAERAAKEIAELRRVDAAKIEIHNAEECKRSIYGEMHALRHQARLLQCPMRQQLINYLVKFYNRRIVSFDQRLIITTLGFGTTRLRSQGAEDFYLDAPIAVQQAKLGEYREEMNAFTQFLKTCYFSSARH